MADAFSYKDANELLNKKHVMFIGDSNIRAQYKDLVWLLNDNTLIKNLDLRKRLENTFLGDSLVAHGVLDRGRHFQEVREYDDDRTRVDFMFIPRCFNQNIEKLFTDMKNGYKAVPDVIVINSCLWDLTRWGPNGIPKYKDNMVKLMRLMSETLPKKTLVIWTTALPTAAHVKGGLIVNQIKHMEPLLRFEVMEANTFARDVVVKHGFDLLDFHFQNRMQIHRRAKDGIHYSPVSVRFMTNLLLTHIALSWDRALPGNIVSILLHKAAAMDIKPKEEPVKMPTGGIFSRISLNSPEKASPYLSVTFGTGVENAQRRIIVESAKQPTVPGSKDRRPIHSRLYNKSNEQNMSPTTIKQTVSINFETLPKFQQTIRHVYSQPKDENETSGWTNNQDMLEEPPLDPLDKRPILRRLYSRPNGQSDPSVSTNSSAGPVRNRNKKKERNFYRRNEKYGYRY